MSLDEQSMIPDIINISEAKVSDRRGVDDFRYEKDTIFGMSGMAQFLARCKSSYTPCWREVLANDKGVHREVESERSHQQI